MLVLDESSITETSAEVSPFEKMSSADVSLISVSLNIVSGISFSDKLLAGISVDNSFETSSLIRVSGVSSETELVITDKSETVLSVIVLSSEKADVA